VVLAAGCAGSRQAARPDPILPEPTAPPFLLSMPEETRSRIVAAAARLVGVDARAFDVDGLRFNGDCSGYVAAVYQAEGIPLRDGLQLEAGDAGSSAVALYRMVAAHGLIFGAGRRPLPGDLVFFNDTYDRNGNGAVDDPLTHVGIVEEVSGGTVRFLHRGSRGVARGVMDLGHRDRDRDASGAVVNTPLRLARRGDPPGTRYLSAQLFAGFGRFDPARIAAALEGSPRLSLRALGLDEEPPPPWPLPRGE
jgi:hypothetical protein